jgi:predicted MFS family arabinose efflux permease
MSASSAPGLTRIVVVMVIAQIVNATFGNAASVYAPVVAPELGVPAQAVGVYLAVLFGTGLVTGLLFVGAVRRYGAVRIMQTVALCHAIGFALPAAGSAVAALVGAFVMGASAGVALPASAHIIARVTPREQLGLVFSLKQTGAPIAIGLVGILIPAMLLVMHWRASMLVLSLAGLAMVALLEPLRAALDDDRVPSTPLRGASLLAFRRRSSRCWATS